MMTRMATVAAVVAGGAYWASARPAAAGMMTSPAAISGVALASSPRDETIVFAGGCFWGVQAVFEHVRGVKSAVSGYAGGTMASPSYEDVSSGTTGHAESVQVTYDASQVSLGTLLQVFFSVAHDPTQKDRQGPDVGTQYRSAIFYVDEEQRKIAESYIRQLDEAKVFSARIATQVAPLKAFYEAEAYHQNYLVNHPNEPYIVYNDAPKLVNLRKVLPELTKQR